MFGISDEVRATAGSELISYLRAMGGSPLVTNGAWNVSNFNPKVWFDFEPNFATILFLQHHLNQCKDPRNQSQEILCFQADQKKYHGKLEQEILKVLKSLKLNQSAKEAATESAINFILRKRSIVGELENIAKFEVVKIKDLAAKFPKYNLNWLKIINDQLMKKSRHTGDDEILFENPDMMTQLFKLMEETKERFEEIFYHWTLHSRFSFNFYFGKISVILPTPSLRRSSIIVRKLLFCTRSRGRIYHVAGASEVFNGLSSASVISSMR